MQGPVPAESTSQDQPKVVRAETIPKEECASCDKQQVAVGIERRQRRCNDLISQGLFDNATPRRHATWQAIKAIRPGDDIHVRFNLLSSKASSEEWSIFSVEAAAAEHQESTWNEQTNYRRHQIGVEGCCCQQLVVFSKGIRSEWELRIFESQGAEQVQRRCLVQEGK